MRLFTRINAANNPGWKEQWGSMSKSYTNWEDIVFEHRNKDYGAYLLRYNYPYYLTISALIVMILFISGMFCPRLFIEKQMQVKIPKKTVIKYARLAQPPPIEKIYIPPMTTPVIQEKIQKYITPKVTGEEVKEEEEMPAIEEVQEYINTAETDIQGIGQGEIEVIAPPPIEEEVEATPSEPDLAVKPPEFPGGDKALAKWLENHLKYPPVATRMGIQGIVLVEFTVDIQGKISDVTIVQSLHRLCDNEAMRLIKSMPAWSPGESNGEKVVAKRKLPIPFVLG